MYLESRSFFLLMSATVPRTDYVSRYQEPVTTTPSGALALSYTPGLIAFVLIIGSALRFLVA